MNLMAFPVISQPLARCRLVVCDDPQKVCPRHVSGRCNASRLKSSPNPKFPKDFASSDRWSQTSVNPSYCLTMITAGGILLHHMWPMSGRVFSRQRKVMLRSL